MKLVAEVKNIQGRQLNLLAFDDINMNHLDLMFNNEKLQCEVVFTDPRLITPEQRKFIYAVFKDVSDYTGYNPEDAKGFLKFGFTETTDIEFSLSDVSREITNLFIDYLIEFCLSNHIPFKKKYEYLLESNYWFYCCLKYRECCICREEHAQVAHCEAVGAGRNRNKIDNRQHHFMALCDKHHREQHRIGIQTFINKHKVKPIKLNEETMDRLHLHYEKEGK